MATRIEAANGRSPDDREGSAPPLEPEAAALAAGTRVLVRGEEWLVEKCLPVSTGGYAVHVHGLSELVRHHKAIFLSDLDRIEPVRSEDTRLVPDESPEYRQTRLFLETLLRRTPPTDALLHLGHQAAIEVMPYQLLPATRALSGLRPRLLIADGVGLGKTIEVGILLSELIKRDRGRRILVVAVRSMLAQFQEELWNRFTIPLVRLDSVGIQRVQAKIPSNRNPFTHHDRVIVSVDTLKNNARYRAWLEQTRWDVVVVDECHNVANRGSQRERLARLLAATCDSLILTSATPHNGRPESFANLMRMLDPTAVADEQRFTYEDVKHFFVRRFKKDIEREARGSFSERAILRHDCSASPEEEAALTSLRSLTLHTLGRRRHGHDRLFPWVLLKALLSSPEACLDTIGERVKRLDEELASDEPHPHAAALARDRDALNDIRLRVEASRGRSSKLARLISELRSLGFDGTPASPRVIVFSERIATLEHLDETLREAFGIARDSTLVEIFHASIGDTEQQRIVESFGKSDSPVRLLLASDAASEGVNLHYYCNQLFHYDVPWSLIRLEQRMGRIDRFGQQKPPQLHYLLTVTGERGADQLIVERLIEKEKQVHSQLGEAGVVLGLYDPDAEDEHITTQLANGVDPAVILPDRPVGRAERLTEALDEGGADDGLPPDPDDDDGGLGIDLLALLAESAAADAGAASPVEVVTARDPSLFASDFAFACAALAHLQASGAADSEIRYETAAAHQALSIWPPESFSRWREPFLPIEAIPAEGEPYRLVADRARLFEAMLRAREQEGEWPAWQLLWEQHPIVEWLLDSLAVAYARNEAPCVRAPALGGQRSIFLMQGILSNLVGSPIHSAWFGLPVHRRKGAPTWEPPMDLAAVLADTRLAAGLTNPGRPPRDLSDLSALVPQAIARARQHLEELHERGLAAVRKDVRHATRRVERWKEDALALVAARAGRALARSPGGVPAPLARKLEDRRRDIARRCDDHNLWLESLIGHGQPYLRLCAVFVGEG